MIALLPFVFNNVLLIFELFFPYSSNLFVSLCWKSSVSVRYSTFWIEDKLVS